MIFNETYNLITLLYLQLNMRKRYFCVLMIQKNPFINHPENDAKTNPFSWPLLTPCKLVYRCFYIAAIPTYIPEQFYAKIMKIN